GPASDDVINLLHRTGLAAPHITAEVREWVDGRLLTAAISRAREALPAALAGILGPDAVWDASARGTTAPTAPCGCGWQHRTGTGSTRQTAATHRLPAPSAVTAFGTGRSTGRG
ncbi:MAG: hypothetical protein ACLP5E_24350, partial [Streptosporangiaceae bacterium]